MGTFTDLIQTTMNAEHDYTFEGTASATLTDQAFTNDLTAGGSGGTGSQTGPTTYEADNGIDLEATRYWSSGYGTQEISDATGAMLFSCRVNTGASGALRLYSFGNSGGAYELYVRVNMGVGENRVQVGVGDGIAVRAMLWESPVDSIAEDTDYLIIVSQPGDGTGVDIWINGAAQTISETVTGAGSSDDWFDYIAPLSTIRHMIGAGASSTPNQHFDGIIYRAALNMTVPTTQNVADLYAAWDTPQTVYDQIFPIAAPEHWYRFSDASGGVTDEGYAGSLKDLSQIDDGGAANMTYQAEANPYGDGYGVKFNGQGGFTSAHLGISGSTGTMIGVFRTTGTHVGGGWLFGLWDSFDDDYIRFGPNTSNGYPIYSIQDGGADDEYWVDLTGAVDDDAVHSVAITKPASTTATPIMHVDGVNQTSGLTHSGDDNVDNDWWWDDSGFSEKVAVGVRGGVVNNTQAEEIVAYEFLIFNTALTDQEIADIHVILTNAGGVLPAITFSTKTIRRVGRRLFSANV